MKKQKMFLRMITASLFRRRSRMLVALLAIAIGATILSGLVTIYYDVPRQMGAQMRNYGANMLFLPASNDDPVTMEDIKEGISKIKKDELIGFTPYRYETVRINEQPIMLAGTDIEATKLTSPYWHIEGEYPTDSTQMLMGKEIAQILDAKTGDSFTVTYSKEVTDLSKEQTDEQAKNADSTLSLSVSGILETGGNEEKYIYTDMSVLNELTGELGGIDLAELSVNTSAEGLKDYLSKTASDKIAPKLVKKVASSEASVLTKLQALVFLVTSVVLALTMVCVATTMTAVVTERRKEIGLRKALGAPNSSIILEFMGEGLLLGGFGGLLGSAMGYAFARYVSMNVFNSSIDFKILLVPVTIAVSVLVTALACILPVRSATDVDPAIVLKGE